MPDTRRASLLDFAIAASIAVVPVLLAVLLSLGTIAPAELHRNGGDSHVSVRQVAALKTFERAIVRRDAVQAGPSDAQVLIRQLPDCAAEWGARDRAFDRAFDQMKDVFGHATKAVRTPAQRIARELREIDEALLRMSAGGNRRVLDAVGFDTVRWADAARQGFATPIQTRGNEENKFTVRCSDLSAAVAMLSRADGRMLATLAWRGSEVDRTTASWQPGQYVEISARHLAPPNPWRGLPGCFYLG